MSSVSDSEASSHSSFSTGTGGSVISNNNSDVGALSKLSERDQDASIQDLLQQNKGLWDAAFSCLLLLTKNRAVKGYRMLAFRIVFEYLQIFRLVFNTRFLWVIHTDLWIWKAFYWVMFRFLIWDMGYDKYVMGAYVICGVVLALTVLTVIIAVVLRKDDSANVWLARVIWLLQNGALLVFSICWVAVVDYLVFMFTCSWGHGNTHLKWTTTECVVMPHLASMVFAGATAIITVVVVACLAMAECSGNLVSDNLLASPVAETAFKTTALKVVMICVSTCLDEFPKPQAVLMFICPCLSAYLQIRSSPYLLPWMNHLWTGLWTALVYTTAILLSLNYYQPEQPWDYEVPDTEMVYREQMTWAVLYGIFPALLLGVLANWLIHRWKVKPVALFEKAKREAADGRVHLESAAVLKGIYRFQSPAQVAFLARCVRRFDPVTDMVLPEAAALCNLIIQAGLARFPNDPTILLVYANFIIHVKKEPRAARQQLQLASKGEPGIIERYNIFAANDVLKRNRSDSDAGLDLMAYVEFQRNYRACIKAHKMALLAQRAFWRSLMHDSLKLTDLLAGFKAMEAAEQTSIYVYKRVLERYPQNGKLLKVWGRFQEWVLHDPNRASRSYAEAIKRGLGDNMLNLTSDDAEGTGADVGTNKIDEKLDGVIIIDAGGSILMANKVANRMFGYGRGELDGKNVNVLMPQPFSGRHDSYLSNYLSTGVAKILNTSRSVVALTKDRSIFPLNLMVTRLSGTGQESVFMGVMRVAESEDDNVVRVWCTTSGVILCADLKLGEWFGVKPAELTGRPISTLGAKPEALDRFASFVRDACGPSKAAAAAGHLKLQTTLLHKYLQSMDVEVTTAFGGTESEPVLMLRIRSVSEAQCLMVIDDRLRIVYATDTLAKLLGTSVGALTELSLPTLIPPPAAQLHKRWMSEMGGVRPPPTSCRAGGIVPMLGLNGAKVPVRLEIKTVDNSTQDHVQQLHIVRVHKASAEQQLDSQRVKLTVDQRGVVLAASETPRSLFGFEPAADLVGQPLAAFISVFEEFRVQQQAGSQQHGVSSSSGAQGPPAAQQQYSQLALQIGPGGDAGGVAADDSVLLTLLAQAAQEGKEACYRVGVRPCPVPAEQIGKAVDSKHQQEVAGMSQLLAALGGRGSTRLRSALMRVDVMETDWTQDNADSRDVKFEVQLWHTEHIIGALELDARLKVVKSEPTVSQMLGLSSSDVNRKLLSKLLALPSHVKESADLLRAQGQGQHKASALKKKAHGAKDACVGPVLDVEAVHGDGQPVKLQLQAVAKEGQASRLLLRVKLAHPPSTGSLPALLQLCGAAGALGLSGAKHLAAAASSAAAVAGAGAMSVRLGQQGGPKAHAGLTVDPADSRPSSADMAPEEAAAAGRPAGSRSIRAAAAVGDAAADRAAVSKGLRFAPGADDEEQLGSPGRTLGALHGRQQTGPGARLAGIEESEDGQDGGAEWEHLRSPVASAAGGRPNVLQSSLYGDSGPGEAAGRRKLGGRGSLDVGPGVRGSFDREQTYEAGCRGGSLDRGLLIMGGPRSSAEGRDRGAGGMEQLTAGGGRGSMEGRGPQLAAGFRGSMEGGQGGYGGGRGSMEGGQGWYGGGRGSMEGGQGGYGGGRGSMDRDAGGARSSMDRGPGGDDGASDVGDEEEGSKLDIGSASDADGGEFGEEDVTCDWRRAKRLRRILRQFDSPIARSALLRFWRGTWGVVAVLLLAHIICYAVLATIVGQRHIDVYGVQQLANAVDKSQMILLRANFISKCSYPEHQALALCSPSQRATYLAKSLSNVQAMQKLHEGVFMGADPSRGMKLSDSTLLDWWMLPTQKEYVFYDTDPPSQTTAPISLWNLGNRFIRAAQEVNYAAQVLKLPGLDLEKLRFWQYVIKNGKDTLFQAYSASLDLYVLFCWDQLGGLSNLLSGLLVAELVIVAVLAMAFQLDLVRRVCKQRMACFSVFLALPSATLRAMAIAPCQVDEDDEDNSEAEEELELMGGQADPNSTVDRDTGASVKANKSVRMAVDDAEDSAQPNTSSGKPSKLLAKGKRSKGQKELHGVLGWLVTKYRVVRHAAHGTFNRVMKVNGKKLQPARAAFGMFMLPLLVWWLVAIAIFGLSFQKVAMLQAPLTSMQAAAHVQFSIARVRLLANLIGFLPDQVATPERTELLTQLSAELTYLRSEYFSMLYGGPLQVAVEGQAPVFSTSSLFRDPKVAELFFRTTNCLRLDQSTCWQPSSPWYDVSHNGIDAMIQAFLQAVTTFEKLPPSNQTVDTDSYEYTWRVAATDLYDGLGQVSDVFVGTTLTALDDLQQLHTYLLIVTIAILVALVAIILLPFKKRVVMESVRLAGLLSQLPQESDVEGQVKLLVLDAASGHKHTEATNKNWSLARGVTAAAAAAARAAASRAAGAVGNIKARMDEASAASAAAAAAAQAGDWGDQAGGWQQYNGGEAASEDASSVPDWE